MIAVEPYIHPAVEPPKISERVFGLYVGCLLSVLSLAPLLLGRPWKPRLLAFALGLASLALLCPILLKRPQAIWFRVTHTVAKGVNFVLMVVMFFGVLTPVACVLRLLGRDPLRRKLDFKVPTYWVARPKSQPGSSMGNQF